MYRLTSNEFELMKKIVSIAKRPLNLVEVEARNDGVPAREVLRRVRHQDQINKQLENIEEKLPALGLVASNHVFN